MDEQLTYQLLKIMKHNGNVWELISGGYEFGQVAFFLDTLKQEHYIALDETGNPLRRQRQMCIRDSSFSVSKKITILNGIPNGYCPAVRCGANLPAHRLFTSQKGDACCSGMIAFTLSGVGAKMSSRHE